MVLRLFIGLIIAFLQLGNTALAAPGDKRPNILFAISDDQSFPHTSAYGTEWVKTPAFDRVAKSGADPITPRDIRSSLQ